MRGDIQKWLANHLAYLPLLRQKKEEKEYEYSDSYGFVFVQDSDGFKIPRDLQNRIQLPC